MTDIPVYFFTIVRRFFPHKVASREKGEVKMSVGKPDNGIKSDKPDNDEPVQANIGIITGVTGQVSLLMVL